MSDAGNGLLLLEFAGAVGIIAWRDYHANPPTAGDFGLPPPGEFFPAIFTFGLLGIAASLITVKLAATLGAGLLLAIALGILDPGPAGHGGGKAIDPSQVK